jgi:hypothetical protein
MANPNKKFSLLSSRRQDGHSGRAQIGDRAWYIADPDFRKEIAKLSVRSAFDSCVSKRHALCGRAPRLFTVPYNLSRLCSGAAEDAASSQTGTSL